MEYEIIDLCQQLSLVYPNISFDRLNTPCGLYITSKDSELLDNDLRIFKETQIKRLLRSSLSNGYLKLKLNYFSQNEKESSIYKNDMPITSCQNGYSIHNIGHSTQLIQLPNFNLLTDPVFNSLNNILYPEKTISYPELSELPKIDVITISHNHRDHLDKSSLKKLLAIYAQREWDEPLVLVPKGDKSLLRSFGYKNVEEVDWFIKIIVKKKTSLNIISIPADHRSGRYYFDHHKSLVCGYIIYANDKVLIKVSGDTKSNSESILKAIDATIWNEIRMQRQDLPDIICLEPSGPNYTRYDMETTHQSTSFSTLLRFYEAQNLSVISGIEFYEFLNKIKTVLVHHNKFELGPDRFNEGLYVLKKMLKYLDFTDEELINELARQKKKLSTNRDQLRFNEVIPFYLKPIIYILPKHTSLLTRSKYFIIEEIIDLMSKVPHLTRNDVKNSILKTTFIPKIGERLDEQSFNEKILMLDTNKYSYQKLYQ